MPTAEQIKALLRSYSEANAEQFLSIAVQVAAHEARAGRAKFAKELKSLIDEIKQKQANAKIGGAIPIARPSGELATLFCVTYPKVRFSEMVLSTDAHSQLERIIREYRQQAQLREHALSERRKLLLVGPPGCGKTMTSQALAGELKLPHLSVQLHGLITKYMGETAVKLHAIFESMHQIRGVYLFDEFDAIGAERKSGNDVGEIRRVLNSFLQFLEQDSSDSIIIAATNFEQMLDDALFRRFDDVIHYEKPHDDEIQGLIENRLARFKSGKLNWSPLIKHARGLSHADICKACDDAAKDSILEGHKSISTEVLELALAQRRSQRKTK